MACAPPCGYTLKDRRFFGDGPFAVLLIPLGFGVWQLAAAAITGFIAKENVVGTLAVVYGLTAFIIYQFGTLITEGHLGVGFVPGLIAVLCMAAAVVLIGKRIRSHFDEEYALHQAVKQGAKA